MHDGDTAVTTPPPDATATVRAPHVAPPVGQGDPRLVVGALLLLTFGTGVVDAVSFLGLEGVFTANMTGNIVFVGLGAAGHAEPRFLHAATAALTFLAGAFVAGRLARRPSRRLTRWTPTVTGLVVAAAVAVGAAAVVAAGTTSQSATAAAHALVVLLSLGMAFQGVAARRLAAADLPTIVVTSTMLGLAADLAAGSGRTGRRFAAVLSLGAGAALGALLLRVEPAVPLLVTSCLLLAVGLVGERSARADATKAAR